MPKLSNSLNKYLVYFIGVLAKITSLHYCPVRSNFVYLSVLSVIAVKLIFNRKNAKGAFTKLGRTGYYLAL